MISKDLDNQVGRENDEFRARRKLRFSNAVLNGTTAELRMSERNEAEKSVWLPAG